VSTASHLEPVTFVLARDEAHDTATLWVIGMLDEFTVGAFEAELERLVPSSRSLIVELSSCTFISSAALATLLRLRRRVPNRPIVLVTESAHLTKLIRITGLEPLFPRCDNVVDALVAVARHGSKPSSIPDPSASMESERSGGAVPRRGQRNGSRRELHIAHEVVLHGLPRHEPRAS